MRKYTLEVGHIIVSKYYKRYLDNGDYKVHMLSYMTVLAVAGAYNQYVKVAGIDPDGTVNQYSSWVWLGRRRHSEYDQWEMLYPTVVQWALAYQKSELEALNKSRIQNAEIRGEREAIAKAHELSKNTVTRALVHAHDNGYCAETAVALISAGHKLPVGTIDIKIEATIRLELNGAKDYTVLREIYGRTRGDLPKLIGQSNYHLNDVLYSKPVSVSAIQTAVVSGINLEIPAPVIRPTADVLSPANQTAAHAEVFGSDYDD